MKKKAQKQPEIETCKRRKSSIENVVTSIMDNVDIRNNLELTFIQQFEKKSESEHTLKESTSIPDKETTKTLSVDKESNSCRR